MGLDISTILILVFTILVVLLGLIKIYCQDIRNYVIRRVVYSATRFLIMMQDTGDQIYIEAWARIRTCLENIENKNEPLTMEEILKLVFEDLHHARIKAPRAANPEREILIVSRAINVAALWNTALRAEANKNDKVSTLKLDVRQFINIIKDLET